MPDMPLHAQRPVLLLRPPAPLLSNLCSMMMGRVVGVAHPAVPRWWSSYGAGWVLWTVAR
jgi:hypothetical protein